MGEMQELTTFWFVTIAAVKVVAVFTVLMVVVAYMTLAERRVSAFIQDRLGPNRVGPFGLLQPIADGIKNIIKEETMPAQAIRPFFLLAPVLAILPATILFAVIPFGSPLPTPWGLVEMIVADVSIGFLYILAIGSIGVYGVAMGGWASGSKYSLLGGLRGSAQMISYEVALALSLVPLILLAGDVRAPEIVSMQQTFSAGPPTYASWFLFPLLVGSFFFFISGLAETNRLPFDLPEAEAELITGYHTEYSAMKFSMFMIGEFAHVITVAALVTVFFLGGWDIPFWTGDNIRVLSDGTVIGEPTWWKTVLTLAAFSVKTGLVVVLFVWIRWTLPRFRYDQLMDLGWKFMLEAVTVYILVIALVILAIEGLGIPRGGWYAFVLFVVNLGLAGVLLFALDKGTVIRGAARPATGPDAGPASAASSTSVGAVDSAATDDVEE
ncbi:MAG: NADH-quinone oxidoreductase subunit H [Gemmatimonadetes bacterium]|nr:NADH-quinone oxidoreductase subunit H [Gemmatimonadota bacterium]